MVDTARRELVAGRDTGLAGADNDRLHTRQRRGRIAVDPVQEVDLASAAVV
jgi:hypothetical protein